MKLVIAGLSIVLIGRLFEVIKWSITASDLK